MKSKIKGLNKTEQEANLEFEMDNEIMGNIEKTFQKFKSDFKLTDYKKKYGDKILDNFWELDKKAGEFNFTLIVRGNNLRLKLKSNLDFTNKFLKNLMEYVEFSELSPKIKAKLERDGVKGEWYGSMHDK